MFKRLMYLLGYTPIETVSPTTVSTEDFDATQAITDALADTRFTWRSIGALAKAARMSEDDTRSLLADMCVRRSELSNEVYTVKAPIYTPPASY